ncbi:MAG: hypothetical protein M1819_002659 [Sarea resinae]|nr:MAG: hypothetical protein M1819_002659 [Sarea resinae]
MAALTQWYEGYYDLARGGLYTFKIREMHRKYGPIVRISPYELHIDDPEFYGQLYNRHGRWEKYSHYSNQFGLSRTEFGTAGHDLHRLRRSAVHPFFAKAKVASFEPVIQSKIDKLCERMEQSRTAGNVFPLQLAFTCLTMDIITEFAMSACFDYLDGPDFHPRWREVVSGFGHLGYMAKNVPLVFPLLQVLPLGLCNILAPKVACFLEFKDKCRVQVGKTRERISAGKSREDRDTIFEAMIHSDLSPGEKTDDHLREEAQSLIGAGTETVARTLAVISYYLLEAPEKLMRLRDEFNSVVSTSSIGALLPQLEQLPYLGRKQSFWKDSAGYSLSYGSSTRLQRIAPDRDIYYDDWTIPAGTPVGMTSVLMHQNATIFPAPLEFLPERWLDSTERHRLEHYLVPFSKGSRQCLGINLAHAELYLTIHALFTRFPCLQLYETTRADVEIRRDMFFPEVQVGSQLVRVRVL